MKCASSVNTENEVKFNLCNEKFMTNTQKFARECTHWNNGQKVIKLEMQRSFTVTTNRLIRASVSNYK